MNETDPSTAAQDQPEPFRLPTPGREDLGWLLVGGGIVGSIVTLLRGRRGPAEWAFHLGLVGAGTVMLLQRRRAHMQQAERSILAELDTLDPIARAQVLKAVAEQQIRKLTD